MTHIPPPESLFSFPVDIVEGVAKVLSPKVADALGGVIGKILDPNDPSINVGDPQPPGTPPIPVEAGSKELGAAVKAIDVALSALDLLFKFGWVIPDQYEAPMHGLEGALKTVRGWLV